MFMRILGFERYHGAACDRDKEADKASRKWTNLMYLKLFYGIIFFGVVSVVYGYCADVTLSTMPTPMIRSEQFILSVLIHYPLYLLTGIFSGLITLFILNVLVSVVWLRPSNHLYRIRMNVEKHLPDSGKTEVPHD
ncbi:hypothetical protein [Enterobacter sp.]|uniref:hypothetical protein n=1 Tax=Enterobacter sp. TaxID=42895 RepID=UPI00296E2D3D|nr:hypothetical protein [Enterobacter sp.]